MTTNLQRRLALGLGLALTVFVGLVLYGDIREIGRLLQEFRWELLPAIIGLSLVNYLLRGLRFHYYLRQIGITNIRFWTSLRVFVGGFSLMLTPGQIGEFIRMLWLKNITDAEPARTAPSIMVDRIVDGVVMALLASVGILVYPQIWPLVSLFLLVLLAVIVTIQIQPLAMWVLRTGDRLPVVKRFTPQFQSFYDSTHELLGFRNLVVGLSIGLVAWTIKGVAVYLILVGLGAPNSVQLLISAVFTLAIGALLGGFSGLPAGLGAVELSMTGVLRTVIGFPEEMAATATLMIRLFTLWFAVLTGALTVLIWRKLLFGKQVAATEMRLDGTPEPIEPELTYEQVS